MTHISLLRAAIITAGLIATSSTFAADKSAPTDIKSAMVQRCVDEAVQFKVTDNASAKKVCSCTINVQASQLKLGEFWDIQTTAMKGKDPNSLPALQRIKPELDKCRAGIKMNPPQIPQQSAAPAAKK
jgi:hypothetical protein